MVPPPARSAVMRLGSIEFVLRPAALLLYGGIAAALDVTFLPFVLPGQPALVYHAMALAVMLCSIATTLLHEGGHALAYLLQGIRPVRITLRGGGAGCAAMVDEDIPTRALARALAGPAVTLVIVIGLLAAWLVLPLPVVCRVVAATLTTFSLFDLVFNTLPVHPRCDGTFALRALLQLIQGRRPDDFAVLYLWRPPILAAGALSAPLIAAAIGHPLSNPMTAVAVAGGLALCLVPPGALLRRSLRSRPVPLLS